MTTTTIAVPPPLSVSLLLAVLVSQTASSRVSAREPRCVCGVSTPASSPLSRFTRVSRSVSTITIHHLHVRLSSSPDLPIPHVTSRIRTYQLPHDTLPYYIPYSPICRVETFARMITTPQDRRRTNAITRLNALRKHKRPLCPTRLLAHSLARSPSVHSAARLSPTLSSATLSASCRRPRHQPLTGVQTVMFPPPRHCYLLILAQGRTTVRFACFSFMTWERKRFCCIFYSESG